MNSEGIPFNGAFSINAESFNTDKDQRISGTDEKIEITDKTAAKINSVDVEKVVTITGKVKNIRIGADFSVITVEKTELVKIAVFENISSLDIQQGKNIQVKGKVKEYQGDYEIIADEIKMK